MLPVLDVIDELRDALRSPGVAVLVAPPGTGKTTAVPPALMDQEWATGPNGAPGRIIVAEPRRLATRLAAARMAENAGEPVGATFGYAVRGDRKVGDATRVEVVTEGLMLRRIQADPELDGVSAVLLDEFHERSADIDLLLALLCDLRASLRPDLRLLVMSATLDADRVASVLGDGGGPAPIIRATAPIHPVEVRYRPGSVHDPLGRRVAEVVSEAMSDPGDVLVFLPGRSEIAATTRALSGRLPASVEVVELHGTLSADEQDRAVHPSPEGRRRVVLSTAIAESSITVPGVAVVVDAGRRRTVRVSPRSGLPEMVTVAASRAAADQRAGRAGRLRPGVAYRLWAESEHRFRPEADVPEVLDGDLTSLVLQLRTWGVDDPAGLAWMDPPDPDGIARATQLLELLGALDHSGRMTERGRRMADIGSDPRSAAIALEGLASGDVDTAVDLLAVIETARSGNADLAERVRLSGGTGPEPGAREARRQWQRTLKHHRPRATSAEPDRDRSDRTEHDLDRRVAALTLAGFPDRLARRRPGRRSDDRGRERAVFQLRDGGEVAMPASDSPGDLAASEWLVVVGLDAGGDGEARVHLAAAVDPDLIARVIDEEAVHVDVVKWNPESGKLTGRRQRRLGAITLDEAPLREISTDAASGAVAEVVANDPGLLGGWKRAAELRSRVAFLRSLDLSDGSTDSRWPDWSEERLATVLLDSFGPALGRIRSAGQLKRLDAYGALMGDLDWSLHREIDELAPTTWTTSSGRSVPLRYGELDGDPASVTSSLRLREALGTDSHPLVGPAGARVPVSLELLSPAGRPLQRTSDLPGFWRGSYREVRAEMRGRYPKHPWPERPWEPLQR